MRIQAYSLSEAYQIASQKLGISASDINIEVIKDGSNGFLGFFKKLGEYEAKATGRVKFKEHKEQKKEVKDFRKHKKEDFKSESRAENKSEIKQDRVEKNQRSEKKQENNVEPETKEEVKIQPKAPRTDAFKAFDSMIDTFNADKDDNAGKAESENVQAANLKNNSQVLENSKNSATLENSKNSATLENSELADNEAKNSKQISKNSAENSVNLTPEILDEIKVKLSNLFAVSSFKIEVKEVSKYSDTDVFIRLDGEDCALLIGKEGYRYKALSYLLFNWLNSKYDISIRLEIAEFLKNQEAAVAAYLEGIIEKIEEQGFASTKVLDGVLLKIALEQLRARFPNKYVGIKIAEDGKFIVINDFYKK